MTFKPIATVIIGRGAIATPTEAILTVKHPHSLQE